MKTAKLALGIGLLAAMVASRAQATLVVTYSETPGAMNSTLSNTYVDTFNSDSSGFHTVAGDSALTWAGVGTFTNLNIKATDQYGGAANSNYAVVGLGVNTQSILNLNTPSSYFGLWWSAGDAKNVLDFYSGANGTGTLLAEFTTANLLKKLQPATQYPAGYYGNPNAGPNYKKDSGEPFAFINFFGTPGTAWSSIVVTNNGSSGFEADNYTSRVATFNPSTEGPLPGIVVEAVNGTNAVALDSSYTFPSGMALVPEPSSKWALLLIGTISFGGSLVRRFGK